MCVRRRRRDRWRVCRRMRWRDCRSKSRCGRGRICRRRLNRGYSDTGHRRHSAEGAVLPPHLRRYLETAGFLRLGLDLEMPQLSRCQSVARAALAAAALLRIAACIVLEPELNAARNHQHRSDAQLGIHMHVHCRKRHSHALAQHDLRAFRMQRDARRRRRGLHDEAARGHAAAVASVVPAHFRADLELARLLRLSIDPESLLLPRGERVERAALAAAALPGTRAGRVR